MNQDRMSRAARLGAMRRTVDDAIDLVDAADTKLAARRMAAAVAAWLLIEKWRPGSVGDAVKHADLAATLYGDEKVDLGGECATAAAVLRLLREAEKGMRAKHD